jgi:hypothetical protein
MNLTLLPDTLAICRLDPSITSPVWLPQSGFLSVTRTAEELSIVCCEAAVPDDVICQRGWRGLQVEGPLDFSLTGVMASLAGTLAEAGVSLFAVSTYDTDYILVRQAHLAVARQALVDAGHHVIPALD